jgi:hypothetical protein
MLGASPVPSCGYLRRDGRRTDSKTGHSASLTSQRPRIRFWSDQNYHSICSNFVLNERQNSHRPFMGQVLVAHPDFRCRGAHQAIDDVGRDQDQQFVILFLFRTL